MKKVWAILLVCMLVCQSMPALGESTVADFLKPIWLKAIEEMKAKNAGQAGEDPYVISASEGFEAVRGTVHVFKEYDNEAYVYAELKNTSERTVRISGVKMILYDWNGKKIAKEDYITFSPEVILPGESIFVNEWLYGFSGNINSVGYAAIEIEEAEYSRKKIERYGEARAYIEDDYLYAEWTNTSDAPAFDVAVAALVLGSDGKILDMLCESTYSGTGIAAGSTIIFRRYLNECAFEHSGITFEAHGYRYIE